MSCHLQTAAEGEAKAAQTTVKHNQKKLQEAKKDLAKKQKSGSKLQTEYETECDTVEKLRKKIQTLNFDEDKASEIEKELEKENEIINNLSDKVDQLSSQVAAAEFHFKDPAKGFDRSKVKGVVAKLVRVSNPKYSSALEVAAGGKLYQVIVDNEQTAKTLLSGGQLRNRVTIIPLNKVMAKPISHSVRSAAKQLAGDKAQPAIELVGYEEELSAAMNYAFGSSFVCEDSVTAKKMAFNKDIATRCVTLDGDDFNPSGTLTGGSRNKTHSILTQLYILAEQEQKLEHHKSVAKKLTDDLKAMNKERGQYDKSIRELELKQHSLELLKKRIEGSEAHQLMQAAEDAEEDLKASEEAVKNAMQKQAELDELASSLKEQIKNFDKERGVRIKNAKSNLQEAKKLVETAKKGARDEEAALQGVIAESESAATERLNIQEQLDQCKKTISKIEKEINELSHAIQYLQKQHDDLSADLEAKKSRLRECDEEIVQITKERSELEKHKTDLIIENKKVANRIEALRKGAHSAEDKCRALEREYPWIQSEMIHFGTPGSDYDWEANDPTEIFEEYEKARITIDTLSKRVNKKVMQMFEKAEHEYTELKRKKEVVETDKSKIREVMEELDEKKKVALKTTWEKVNGDLGSIFSTLLPGTMAKLEPVEGTSFMDGRFLSYIVFLYVCFSMILNKLLLFRFGGQSCIWWCMERIIK